MRFGMFSGQSGIGVDISDHSVEILQFNSNSSGVYNIAGFSRGVLRRGVVEGARIQKPDMLANVLRELYSKPTWGKFSGNRTVVSFPSALLYATLFPSPQNAAVPKQVDIVEAATRRVPEDLDNCYYKWRTFKDKDTLYVNFFCALKEDIDAYKNVFKKAGMRISVLEPSHFAMQRAIVKEGLKVDEAICLIQMSTYETDITVVSSRGEHLSHTLPFGGFAFTQALAEKLDVSYREAEGLKRTIGFDPEKEGGRVFLVLQSSIRPMLEEISSVLKFYQQRYMLKISRGYIAGGGALAPGLVPYVSTNTGVAFQLGAFKEKTKPPLDNVLKVILARAGGLAQRGLVKNYAKATELNLV